MTDENRTLPPVLARAHSLGFSEDHEGVDFQESDRFDGADDTNFWWREWTGNPDADDLPFRVFGRDGTGGLAGFWVREPDAALESQPIVFLGSEGEVAVVARNLDDYLWLIANGAGPLEIVDGIDRDLEPIPDLVALAREHTGLTERPVDAVIAAAQEFLPELTALVDATCR